MNPISTFNSNQIQDNDLGSFHLNSIKKYTGLTGRLMGALSLAVKVQGDNNEVYYVKVNDILNELVSKQKTPLSTQTLALLSNRILEITDEDTKKPLSQDKLKLLFNRFFADKQKDPDHLESEKAIVKEFEILKQDLTEIKKINFTDHLSEVVSHLKPGDFLVRKYHEDNSNIICDLQKFFHPPGYRESYKCSHIALYLGEIDGKHWVAEAAWPRANDPQIRRVVIDDPRFALKAKNQLLIIRNNDVEAAKEAAHLAENYTVPLLPEDQRIPTEAERISAIQYSIFEASRSMWHSPKLSYFGKQRLMKFYTDYKHNVRFEYLGQERGLFCSHFAVMMQAISEMNRNTAFQSFLEKHPLPAKYDESKTGFALAASKVWYSIRKGLWARWMTVRYGDNIQNAVTTQLDSLRTSPQSSVQYMMDHKEKFEVIGLVSHKGDIEK